jgi:tRNA(Leu) C34 or U34 (ribose-2'-O)-methylase TrmL
LGQILRLAETLQIGLEIFDPRDLLGNTENYKTVSDFSCGAFDRLVRTRLLDRHGLDSSLNNGRLIATCVGKDAVSLPEFRFADNDVVLFGNEYDGLPEEILKRAPVKLYVPLPPAILGKPRSYMPIDPSKHKVENEGIPNLSVSATCAIVAYAVHLQRLNK